MKDFETKLARLCGEVGRTLLAIEDKEERERASKTFALMLGTYAPTSVIEAYKQAINELPIVLKDPIVSTLIMMSVLPKGSKKMSKLHPVHPNVYRLSVSDFLAIVKDAQTHGLEVIMADGKLFYRYANESED